jgi:hypothetical protein
MTDEQLDDLATILYHADMIAQGDPLVYKWSDLGEPWKSRYRAMSRSAAQTFEKHEHLEGIETAIQLLTANIINLRTELLVVKAHVNSIAIHTHTTLDESEG